MSRKKRTRHLAYLPVKTTYTIQEIADHFRVDRRFIIKEIESGELEAVYLNPIYRIPLEAFIAYVQKKSTNPQGLLPFKSICLGCRNFAPSKN